MLNIQYGKRRIPIYTFERTGNDGQMYLAKGTSLILLILAFGLWREHGVKAQRCRALGYGMASKDLRDRSRGLGRQQTPLPVSASQYWHLSVSSCNKPRRQ